MRWRLGFSGWGRPAPSPASAPGSITNELVKAGEIGLLRLGRAITMTKDG